MVSTKRPRAFVEQNKVRKDDEGLTQGRNARGVIKPPRDISTGTKHSIVLRLQVLFLKMLTYAKMFIENRIKTKETKQIVVMISKKEVIEKNLLLRRVENTLIIKGFSVQV